MTQFKLNASPLNLNLRHTFTISRWSRDVAPNVLIELEADGITGIGEAAPNARYGESQDSSLAFLNKLKTFSLRNPFDTESFLDLLKRNGAGEWSAKVGAEMALLDWVGKKLNVPIHTLWNADRTVGPRTCFTIGITSMEEMPERIREAAPYPVLKIKLGTDHDLEIIENIRMHTDKPIWVDANEGWKTLEIARTMTTFLADRNVEIIEQPMPSSMLSELAELKYFSPVPIIADESFTGHEKVNTLKNCFHGINLKIMKTGSLRRSMQWVQRARLAGLKIMVGCMIESSIADTASAVISLWADYADLDGHLLINDDPYVGLSFDDQYRVHLNQLPGLGVIPRI